MSPLCTTCLVSMALQIEFLVRYNFLKFPLNLHSFFSTFCCLCLCSLFVVQCSFALFCFVLLEPFIPFLAGMDILWKVLHRILTLFVISLMHTWKPYTHRLCGIKPTFLVCSELNFQHVNGSQLAQIISWYEKKEKQENRQAE